jgi:hypothetical protein
MSFKSSQITSNVGNNERERNEIELRSKDN